MDFGDVEDPARLQEVGNHPGPTFQVGQPAEHAARRIDDVESSLETTRQVVDVRDDEAGGHANVAGELACLPDSRFREIYPGHPSAESRPAERVESEVTLEMQEVLALDRADFFHFVG